MLKYLCFVLCISFCAGVYIAKGECPTNEEYLLCGPDCSRTCEDPFTRNCTYKCVKGCYCMKGYLRNENGTCVSADKCMPNGICGENEEFLPCGTACPATCAVPEPEVCGFKCSVGCFCKEGFYRDEVDNKCVTLDNCTSTSDDKCFNQNEVYDICNANCEPSCSQPEPVCTKDCTSGCICAPGLLRSPDGECVSVDKCPSTNGTSPDVLTKYLTTISKILHMTAA